MHFNRKVNTWKLQQDLIAAHKVKGQPKTADTETRCSLC